MGDNPFNFMLPVGLVLGLLGIMLMFRQRRRRRLLLQRDPQPSLRLVRAEQEQTMRRDIEQMSVELHEQVRRTMAHLNQKTLMLEKAIRDADERNARLQATLAEFDARLKARG